MEPEVQGFHTASGSTSPSPRESLELLSFLLLQPSILFAEKIPLQSHPNRSSYLPVFQAGSVTNHNIVIGGAHKGLSTWICLHCEFCQHQRPASRMLCLHFTQTWHPSFSGHPTIKPLTLLLAPAVLPLPTCYH